MLRPDKKNIAEHLHYSTYYTPELAELVSIRDRQLIERFGYAFEEVSSVEKNEVKAFHRGAHNELVNKVSETRRTMNSYELYQYQSFRERNPALCSYQMGVIDKSNDEKPL